MVFWNVVELLEIVVEVGEYFCGGVVVKSGDEGFGFGLVLAAELEVERGVGLGGFCATRGRGAFVGCGGFWVEGDLDAGG